MTGTELLTNTIALMGESDTSPYTDYAVPLINLVLAETFELNNNVRLSKELAPLSAIPTLTAVTDALTYETEVLLRVVPLGLVGRLYVDEGNTAVLSMYKQEYAIALDDTNRKIATVEWF